MILRALLAGERTAVGIANLLDKERTEICSSLRALSKKRFVQRMDLKSERSSVWELTRFGTLMAEVAAELGIEYRRATHSP